MHVIGGASMTREPHLVWTNQNTATQRLVQITEPRKPRSPTTASSTIAFSFAIAFSFTFASCSLLDTFVQKLLTWILWGQKGLLGSS